MCPWPECIFCSLLQFLVYLSVYFKIRKFIFRQSESCVLTMSSWSRRVKICGLKSYTEMQLPTVSGNLKKMLYSCLCTSFVSCYCVFTVKIDENDNVVTIYHFSRLRVGSLLVSYWDSTVWPDGLCTEPISWMQLPILTISSSNPMQSLWWVFRRSWIQTANW